MKEYVLCVLASLGLWFLIMCLVFLFRSEEQISRITMRLIAVLAVMIIWKVDRMEG